MLKNKIGCLIAAIFLIGGASVLYAQGDVPNAVLGAEQNIGGDCPVASAIEPDTGVLWVLMDNCGSDLVALQRFDMNTGTLLDPVPLITDDVDFETFFTLTLMNPLAFALDGSLRLYGILNESETLISFAIDPATGELTAHPDGDDSLNAFLGQFTSYIGYSVTFSPDHTYATVLDDDGLLLTVVNIASQEVLLEVEGIQAAFAPNNGLLYAAAFTEPDNINSDASIVSVYSLPDGELLTSVEMPIPTIYPSPDGRYAVLATDRFEGGLYILGHAELSVLDLETGTTSPRQLIGTGPRPALTCVNDGRSIADLNMTTGGDLPLIAVHWLADSSGFITVNSHGGQITNTGCVLEYSRLRQYSISGG